MPTLLPLLALACTAPAPLFPSQSLDLHLPQTLTLVVGLEQQALASDPALDPAAQALSQALADANITPDPAPMVLACAGKGCFLELTGSVSTWERPDALPSQPGHLTWSVGAGHRRQLAEEEGGGLILGDRSAMQHTRERVPLLDARAGEDMVPQGPIWLWSPEPLEAINHLQRRLGRSPHPQARGLRQLLLPLPALLAELQVELVELGLSVTPSHEGLALHARLKCADRDQARRLAVALRYGLLQARLGRPPDQSEALARVPVQQRGRQVELALPDLHKLVPEL